MRTTMMELGERVSSDLYSGRVVRVANGFVFKAQVFNDSGEFPSLWDEIVVPVRYGQDHHHRLARRLLEGVVRDTFSEQHKLESLRAWAQLVHRFLVEKASLEPNVSLIVTDNWLQFTMRCAADFKQRCATKDELFTRILDAFAANDGRVSIASTTILLLDAPALQVQLSGEWEAPPPVPHP
ncbi:mechanosensitive ion channel [Synechococcus sp. ATX 2A4]|uniref:mechanosensitive ion channel n=1 Tax=Synechococcus sp. ATX 2A4 TaxID=2823727 RepID=UPI0020CECEBA|nr:mechanosensitive ion channel [Synechococcus sp. ATX 2A4]